MKHELIERYIYAVVRLLPQKTRPEVEKELESLIGDMLETRCGAVLPTEKDVRVVLTELGTPEELAAKYSGEEKQALISGIYLLIYKRVLKIVLPIMAAVVLLSNVLNLVFDGSGAAPTVEFFAKAIGATVGGAFSGVLSAFSIVTIVFAILERKKAPLQEGDMFSRLPAVPKDEARIKRHDPIMGMIWATVFTVLFLVFPWFAGAWVEGVGWVPVFQTAVIRSLWLPIILWGALGIGKEAYKLIAGQYTKRLAIVTVIADLLMIACAVVVLAGNGIMNPDFVSQIGGLIAGDGGAFLSKLLANVHVLLLGIVIGGSTVDMITVAAKAFKYGRA
ncbi:MAG: hypothetical protein FWE69_04795 [Clostridiales bacterium]|nr:hypothetical protein [Clostridiales bacterium]